MKRRGLLDLTNCTANYCHLSRNETHCAPLPIVHTNDNSKLTKMKKDVYLNEYANNIFGYLLVREQELGSNSGSIFENDSNRRVNVIMWFVTVANKISMSNDCIHLAVALFDRYRQLVDQIDYMFSGIIILWIASKVEGSFTLTLKHIINQTHLPYDNELKIRCLQMEKDILTTLDFNVNIPTPIQFLRHLTKVAKANEPCHQSAKFIIDVALTDIRFFDLPYSLMAASAFCIADDLVSQTPKFGHSWTTNLRRYSSIDKMHLLPIMIKMVDVLIDTHRMHKQLMPLYKRYSKTIDSNHLSKESLKNYRKLTPGFAEAK